MCACVYKFKFMTMTCRFVTLEWHERLIFYLGKYDTNTFWQEPNLQSESSCQKTRKVWKWKTNVQIETKNLFSPFHPENLILADASYLQTELLLFIQIIQTFSEFCFEGKKIKSCCSFTSSSITIQHILFTFIGNLKEKFGSESVGFVYLFNVVCINITMLQDIYNEFNTVPKQGPYLSYYNRTPW
jgi:hypothetical protein